MNDATLLRIATTAGLLGILALFILSETLDLAPITYDEAREESDGSTIALEGTVQQTLQRGNATFIILNSSCTMKGVLFDKKDVIIPPGTHVIMRGTLQTYEGEREILVEEMDIVT